MTHSSFLGSCKSTEVVSSQRLLVSSTRTSLTVSIVSCGSLAAPLEAAAFLPAPLAHGEILALKRVAEAELMDLANRRMSSV